jgi:hypothetical protein
MHLVEGLLSALAQLDAVVQVSLWSPACMHCCWGHGCTLWKGFCLLWHSLTLWCCHFCFAGYPCSTRQCCRTGCADVTLWPEQRPG